VSRFVIKSWQNQRPGWTRRVRWLEGAADIRLVFEDPDGIISLYFDGSKSGVEEAQGMFDRFREGLVNVKELMP
jgi:hypothetical protein